MSPRQRSIRLLDREDIRGWGSALATALLALAALIAGSSLESSKEFHPDRLIVGWIATAVMVVFGVMAVRRTAAILGRLVTSRAVASVGAAVRLLTTGVGYVFLLFASFGLISVSIEHLLVGAGLAGVVLGIAAQQSLGNVFAGLLLLMAKTVRIGEHVRIRSGALGGVFDADILEISLIYVTVRTEDGIFKLPNSAILASGVGIVRPAVEIPIGDDDPTPTATQEVAPVQPQPPQ